jgi:hypothetical protein
MGTEVPQALVFFIVSLCYPPYLISLNVRRIIGCLGGSTGNPLQAYLFAQILHVTTFTGHQLQVESAHWALMFLILALGIGAAYFILGWSSTALAMVSLSTCCNFD